MGITMLKAAVLLLSIATVSSNSSLESHDYKHQFNNDKSPESILYTNTPSGSRRIRGMRETRHADFVLGGLFPAHTYSRNGEVCGDPAHIPLVDAMLFALDNVNSDPNILPNITLGYDIRDTCFIERIGLDEAADLILTGTQHRVEKYTAAGNEQIGGNKTTSPLTIGLIGAASSSVSIPIASLGRLFNIPQISYASQSSILDNHDRYSYFYRTMPSNSLEVQVIVDLLQHFEWTYISILYSRNSYGQSGFNNLHNLAAKNGICIDLHEGIEEAFSATDYRTLAEKLSQSAANVVVFYMNEQEAYRLLDQLVTVASNRRFIWVASGAWYYIADRLPPHIVSGLFSTLPLFKHDNHFYDYYYDLFPNNNERNPWFPDTQSIFKDVAAANCTTNCTEDTPNPFHRLKIIDIYTSAVIDAVYAFAHALEKYLDENCEEPLVWNKNAKTCNGQKTLFSGSGLLQYIDKVNFTSLTGNHITFNSEGNINCAYSIINYQSEIDQNQSIHKFTTIGTWENGSLAFDSSTPAQFGLDNNGQPMFSPVQSQCQSCAPGQYVRKINASCCGLCDDCLGQMFSNNSEAAWCLNCSMYGEMWGNNPITGSTSCVEMPQIYLQITHPFAVVVAIGSLIGLVLLVTAFILLVIYWNSPVIRSSSRESVVLVLFGAGSSFGASFIYLAPPFLPICALQRVSLWFCFSLMNGSLLIKMIRITRIFVFQKSKMNQHKCAQPYQQVIFSILLVAVQMVIVLCSILFEHPRVSHEMLQNNLNLDSSPEILLTCQPEPLVGFIVSVMYEAGLIVATVILGTLTFKSPANFNESKSVCVSAYILLSIWTMFFVSYFFTESAQNVQNAFIGFTNTLGAYTILGSVVGPRLFTVIFMKKRNSNRFSRREKHSADKKSDNLPPAP